VLAVRLNPVQPQRMQERRKALHETQNPDRQPEPRAAHDGERDPPEDGRGVEEPLENHIPKHLGELRVRERERPEPEVGGGVRDAPEAELDGVDDLVDDHLAEVVLLLSCESAEDTESKTRYIRAPRRHRPPPPHRHFRVHCRPLPPRRAVPRPPRGRRQCIRRSRVSSSPATRSTASR
jgi:hypothetical protein